MERCSILKCVNLRWGLNWHIKDVNNNIIIIMSWWREWWRCWIDRRGLANGLFTSSGHHTSYTAQMLNNDADNDFALPWLVMTLMITCHIFGIWNGFWLLPGCIFLTPGPDRDVFRAFLLLDHFLPPFLASDLLHRDLLDHSLQEELISDQSIEKMSNRRSVIWRAGRDGGEIGDCTGGDGGDHQSSHYVLLLPKSSLLFPHVPAHLKL